MELSCRFKSLLIRDVIFDCIFINSSVFLSAGQSSQLTQQFITQWHEYNPDAQIVIRDVAANYSSFR